MRFILWRLLYFIVFVPVAVVSRAIRPPLELGWQLDTPSYFSPPTAAAARQPGQLR